MSKARTTRTPADQAEATKADQVKRNTKRRDAATQDRGDDANGDRTTRAPGEHDRVFTQESKERWAEGQATHQELLNEAMAVDRPERAAKKGKE